MRAYYSSENSIYRRGAIITLCKWLVGLMVFSIAAWFVGALTTGSAQPESVESMLLALCFLPMNLCLVIVPVTGLVLVVEICIFWIYNKWVCRTDVKFPLLWVGIFLLVLAASLFVLTQYINSWAFTMRFFYPDVTSDVLPPAVSG